MSLRPDRAPRNAWPARESSTGEEILHPGSVATRIVNECQKWMKRWVDHLSRADLDSWGDTQVLSQGRDQVLKVRDRGLRL